MNYDADKTLEMSQSISAIYDHADASLAEACSATALALRVQLDMESDKFMRAFMLTNLIKHLTMDHKEAPSLIKPNGAN
jgi:hypothetical protein